jgi:hypothetical protein
VNYIRAKDKYQRSALIGEKSIAEREKLIDCNEKYVYDRLSSVS